MSKEKETLYIYTRVSTKGQFDKGTSIDTQIELGIKKAKNLGMNYEVFNEENARSTFDHFENRPQMQKILEEIKEGKCKHLYIQHQDRLSRHLETFAVMRKLFVMYGVKVYSEQTGVTNFEDDGENFTFGIFAEVAVMVNQQTKKRMYKGKKRKTKDGFWHGGPSPFGYDLKRTKNGTLLAINDEQSEWVIKMFNWYKSGLSGKDIKRRLDGNIKTKRGLDLWSDGSIQAILRNTHYYGEYEVFGQINKCPAILSKELWDEVNGRMKREDKISSVWYEKWSDKNNEIRDLLVCNHCNSKMGGRSRSYKNEKKYVYQCITHNKRWKEMSEKGDWRRNKYCENNVSMDCERVEDSIWLVLMEVMKESYSLKEKFKQQQLANKGKSRVERDREVKKLVKKQKRNLNQISDIEDLIDRLEVEEIVERNNKNRIKNKIKLFQSKYEELLNEKKDIEIAITSLKAKNLWIDWVKDYDVFINEQNNLSNQEKIELIRKYVKRIGVSFDKESKSHSLNIEFRLKLIDETLNYHNPNNKSDGYEVIDGINKLKVDMDYNVRNIRN